MVLRLCHRSRLLPMPWPEPLRSQGRRHGRMARGSQGQGVPVMICPHCEAGAPYKSIVGPDRYHIIEVEGGYTYARREREDGWCEPIPAGEPDLGGEGGAPRSGS